MCSFIENSQVGIDGGWRYSRTEDNNVEGCLGPLEVTSCSKVLNRVNDFRPVESLNIGSGSIVIFQALQADEGLGKEL